MRLLIKIWPLFLCTGMWLSFSPPPDFREISEAEMGRKLFFDKRFSKNYSVSCADCHLPGHAFSDTAAFSKGFSGKFTNRNAPALTNLSGRPYFFWDGRAPSLEEQVLQPIQHPVEMGMNLIELNKRLRTDKFYVKWFKKHYSKLPDVYLAARAIAAFERTLETGNAPLDRFMDGDSSAISLSAMRGREIFTEKGKCFECHFTPDFTADEFKNIGLFNGKTLNDSGRFNVTKKREDLGKFRVPGLRNISLTAPYMHNGMFRTLNQVIDYYNDPSSVVPDAINRDTLLNGKLHLTPQEKADLLAFLQTLTSASASHK
ncbi:MAG: cytochrome-c peroxidase [Bacteroidetes bacterium]|nr:cytochrome-c peroxidase [Bacteroidota bacterium]